MQATDMQDALNQLSEEIRAAIARYLDAVEHTNTPTISVEYLVAHSIGARNYQPTVTVTGELQSNN